MSKNNFHRNFAIIVGINNYEIGIKELETAVPDALKLAQIIQEQHRALKQEYQSQNKYEVKLILNKRATLNQFKQLIADLKQGQIPLDSGKVKVTKDDRVFFYFAGHGIALEALENQEGPVGYLIPQDATSGDSNTYLPMQELHDALNALPCRHMLAILDCCFAGAFRWASLKREIVPKVTLYKERYDRFITDAAWQVITSAADDQKALDSLGVRGKVTFGNEVHSPFAKALFDALLGGTQGADLNKDGIITATELYSYLRERVEILTENNYKRQTPGLCSLKKHDKGEFIFLLPDFERDKLEDAPPLNLENNPYRGLQSYDEKDSHLFFGRENQIQELYQKVVANKQALTLVLGASGTGKSSLMKAGLLKHLRDSQEQKFEILDPMRPGESPLKALAQVCLPIAITITAEELAKDEQALANIIESWNNSNPQTKLLLAVDQFEELITLCKSDEEREKFQKVIKNAITKYPHKIHVVITLRLDFEAQFQTSVLKDFWNDNTRFVVPPMSQNEFREAIEKPASEKVVYFDPPTLVDELINEVVQMPGALPLLSFTLSELYLKYLGDRTRNNRALTKKDYEDLGRVVGSLTKRANQEYEKLVAEDSAYQDTVRRVMLRMISLQGGELARRQVPKFELVYPAQEESDRVQTVIKRFSEARLIVEGSNSQGEAYVEPAHDALVHGWNKLQEWKNEEQENLVLQQLLTPAAKAWQDNNRNIRDLWDNNSRLGRLKEIRQSNRFQKTYKTSTVSEESWLNQIETEFVDRSIQRRINRLRRLVTSVVAVILSLSGLTAFVFIQSIDAQIQALSASSGLLLASNQDLDALKDSLKAARQLKWQLPIKDDTKIQAVAVLQQVVYRIKELNRFQGNIGNVTWVKFHPDAKTLVSNGNDGKVRLWSIDGQEIKIIQDFGIYPIWCLDMSHDGKKMAFSKHNKVELWSIDGKQIQTFPGTVDYGNVSFSPDGKTLAIANLEKVELWSIDGKKIQTFPGHGAPIFSAFCPSATFSPDGQTLAIASQDYANQKYMVKLWSLDGREIQTFSGHHGVVESVSFSPDGKILASASQDGTVKLWNLDGKLLKTIESKSNWVNSVSFSPDGKNLAFASGDTAEVWSVNGKQLYKINGHGGTVYHISFNPDGKILASASEDGTVRLWSLEDKNPKLIDNSGKIQSMSFSPDGKTLASGSQKGLVTLWSPVDGKKIKVIAAHDNGVNTVSFTPNSKMVVSASYDNTVKVWNLDGSQIRTISGQGGLVNGMSLNASGKLFATAIDTEGGEVKLWSLDGKELKTIGGHTYPVNTVSFSPDSKTVASGDHDGTIKIWSLDGKELQTFTEPRSSIYSLTFSPDGKILAYDSGKSIKLRRLNDKSATILAGHSGVVYSTKFSPDGRTIASGSQDGTVKIWSLDGRELQTLVGHNSSVDSLAFSPDGKTLASADDNGLIILWNLDLDKLLAQGCSWARNYLQTNPNLSQGDRHLCDDVPLTAANADK